MSALQCPVPVDERPCEYGIVGEADHWQRRGGLGREAQVQLLYANLARCWHDLET